MLETEHAGAPGYSFTHALVRHALYSGLSGPRRQRLHARAAAAIEQVEGTAPVAALALHHRLAGSAGDPEKAVDFALQASAQAVARFAWEEAAAHLDGALAVMAREGGRERERADLLVSLGDLMVVVGDLGRQIGALDQALALYEGLGDEARAARVHSRLGMARSLMDTVAAEHLDVGRAFEHFDAARAVLEQGPPHRALGHLEVGVATAWTYGLRIADGLEAAERGMAIAEAVGDELLWAGAAEAFGWHALVVGRLREGFDANARAFAVADRHRRSFLAFMATNIQGQFTWGLGAPDDAQIHFERPLALAYAGDAAHRRQTVDGIGRCHASRGELDAARPYLPDAQATWITHALKPVMDLWDGDLDAVAGLATATLETSRRTGNRWDEWASQALAAKVLALRSAHAEAVPLYEAARSILVSAEAAYFELWLLPDLARSLAELGRVGDARLHVARCQAIVGAGEDWRGRAGMVGVADAVVSAAEGEPDSRGPRVRGRARGAPPPPAGRRGGRPPAPVGTGPGAPGAARGGGGGLPRPRRRTAVDRPRRGRPQGAALSRSRLPLGEAAKVQGEGQGGSPMWARAACGRLLPCRPPLPTSPAASARSSSVRGFPSAPSPSASSCPSARCSSTATASAPRASRAAADPGAAAAAGGAPGGAFGAGGAGGAGGRRAARVGTERQHRLGRAVARSAHGGTRSNRRGDAAAAATSGGTRLEPPQRRGSAPPGPAVDVDASLEHERRRSGRQRARGRRWPRIGRVRRRSTPGCDQRRTRRGPRRGAR